MTEAMDRETTQNMCDMNGLIQETWMYIHNVHYQAFYAWIYERELRKFYSEKSLTISYNYFGRTNISRGFSPENVVLLVYFSLFLYLMEPEDD